jgi:fructokinase
VDRIVETWQQEKRPDALGIASFGPVGVDPCRPDWGFVLKTPKAGWSGVDVAGRYRRLLGVEVGFDTDVNAAALAEQRWGGAVGTSCNAYVTLGTGVGVGIVIGGVPVHGRLHPEFGHLRTRRVAGDDFPGCCPFHGDCIEGLVSGPALAARTGVSGEALGDDHPIWDTVAFELGEFVAALILAVSPERIAFGGGIACARPWLVGRIRRATTASLGGYIDAMEREIDSRIAITSLATRAGPLGAVAIGLSKIR